MPPRVETPRRRVSNNVPRRRILSVVCLIVTTLTLSGCNDDPDTPAFLPTGSDGSPLTRIVFENVDGEEAALLVEIADTPEERGRGLMFRENLPEDQGMIFVYAEDGQHNFYMRDTFIPLSIAFIKVDGTIVEIEDMQPQTEDLHSGPEPYRYTVEANQGWFERNGIAAGSRAIIPPLTPGATPTANTPP